jgi:hypothetical protein
VSKILLRASAVFAVLSAAVTACTSGRADIPALGPIPAITSTDQLARPIDPWLPTIPQLLTVQKAADAVTARCMRGFGLAFPGTTIVPIDATALKDRSETFGWFNPAVVTTKGYDAVDTAPAVRPGAPRMTPAAISVLVGRDGKGNMVTTYNGKPVPAGGCQQQAWDALGKPPGLTPQVLPDGGPTVPATDPRLVAVTSRWLMCMKARGFTYKSPAEAFMDPRWRAKGTTPDRHTSAEIAVATADLDCKSTTNLMGISVALQTAYDQQYIKEHAQALAAFRKHLEAQLALARRLIASP